MNVANKIVGSVEVVLESRSDATKEQSRETVCLGGSSHPIRSMNNEFIHPLE